MEKLFSYTLGRNEITVADIDAICTTQITNKIFDMIEAVATRQQRKALDYYYDLLALKEPPMRILYSCLYFRGSNLGIVFITTKFIRSFNSLCVVSSLYLIFSF